MQKTSFTWPRRTVCAHLLAAIVAAGCASSQGQGSTEPTAQGSSDDGDAGKSPPAAQGQAGGDAQMADAMPSPIDPSASLDPNPPDNPKEPRTSGARATPLPPPKCPPDAPEEGMACEDSGLECGYGDSARWDCRSVFVCEGSRWADRSYDCPEPPEDHCPADMPEGECDPLDYVPNAWGVRNVPACIYGASVCYCSPCDGFSRCSEDGEAVWVCARPPADLDCPEVAPNAGDGCDVQAARCVYGDPCLASGNILFCHEGAWEVEGAVCPE